MSQSFIWDISGKKPEELTFGRIIDILETNGFDLEDMNLKDCKFDEEDFSIKIETYHPYGALKSAPYELKEELESIGVKKVSIWIWDLHSDKATKVDSEC